METKVKRANCLILVAQQQHRQQKQRVKTTPKRLSRRTNSLTTRAKSLTTRANSYNKSKNSRDWLVHFDKTLTFVFLSMLLSLNAIIILSE